MSNATQTHIHICIHTTSSQLSGLILHREKVLTMSKYLGWLHLLKWNLVKISQSFCRQPQQILLLACERLEIMNKNNNLWLYHFPLSHPALDLNKSLFSGAASQCTPQARRRRTCLWFRWAHFPANISFGRHQLHLVIGPLMSSGHPN